MKTLVGGAVAAALGLIGLAIYLGFDEMKDTWKKDESPAPAVPVDELEKYKSEISDLKKELDSLKTERKPE
jgi:hypothetical protein